MRVVIVVKPAGMPRTAGTPNEVMLRTKAMTVAPARTGARSGSVTVRKAVTASAPEAPRGSLHVGLGSSGQAGDDDEVGDRCRFHGEDDDDPERPHECRRRHVEEVVDEAPRDRRRRATPRLPRSQAR